MLKNIAAVICAIALLTTATLAFSSESLNNPDYIEVSIEEIQSVSGEDNCVLTLTPSNYSVVTDLDSPAQLKEFLAKNGIIVYRNDNGSSTTVLDRYFDLAAQDSTEPSSSMMSNSSIGPGKDIATIYYLDRNNTISTHTINVGYDDTQDYDALIDETVAQIMSKDINRNDQALRPMASDEEGEYLGSKSYTYTRPPKGKLVADYEFYTVQNYDKEDYYLVFCDINGIPGAVLHDDNYQYESKYEGEEMTVELVPVTTSVTLDDYGPSRTITSGSETYEVSVGVSLDNISFGHSKSYTRNIYDTEISTQCTSTDAIWELALEKDAQKDNCRFEPAATFVCSYNKSSVKLNLYAGYTLDSRLTAQEEISLDRTITCTSSDVS
ncbi:hypothetical protein [Clostridium phoceensis]|uniref:hypothetical protein n=1 Tax=Clostridium phoceensis TaxID=1650661 RepID=UPI002E765B0F|nr:hypothetical protein [Clostridium phoceensis]